MWTIYWIWILVTASFALFVFLLHTFFLENFLLDSFPSMDDSKPR
jgi:hypothetical protein